VYNLLSGISGDLDSRRTAGRREPLLPETTRRLLPAATLLLVTLLAGCPPAPEAPGPAAPGTTPNAAPWLDAPSPFPDQRPRAEPSPTPETPTATPPVDTPPPAATADGGVPDEPDLGLKLPPGAHVNRLPRASATNPEVPRRPPEGTGPVARVNGEEIPRAIYNERVQRSLDAFFGLTRSMPQSVWKQVVGGTLNQLVRRTIDRQKAAELGVVISPETLEKDFQKFVEDRGGQANWPRFLGHMHVTEEDVKGDLAAKVLHDALIAKGLGDLTITDAAIAEHYQTRQADYYKPRQRRLRQIFFQIPEGAGPLAAQVARSQAEDALRLVRSGKDFAEVARTRSEGATRERGGDLGLLKKGQMPAAFDQVAFSLPVGGISDMVQTELGFHLIQVVEERAGHQRPLDEGLKAEIRKLLQGRTYQQRLLELEQRWYGEAQVEYLDAAIAEEAKAEQQRGNRYRMP